MERKTRRKVQKAQKHQRLETTPDETKLVPNELAKLEKKFPAVLPELVSFLPFEDALALIQTQKDYAQRAEQLFKRYGEFHISNDRSDPGYIFKRWFFRTNEPRPSVRILKIERLWNVRDWVPKCPRLQILDVLLAVSFYLDVTLPAFPHTLQKVDFRNEPTGLAAPLQVATCFRQAFLSSGQEYPKLETVSWKLTDRLSVPPKDFQQWVSLVPALKTLTMSIDWCRNGVLPLLSNLKQLEQVNLQDCRWLPEESKLFDADEIEKVCSIKQLKTLHLSMEDGGDNIEWQLDRVEDKKWQLRHDENINHDVWSQEAKTQLINDQIEFLKQKKHWSLAAFFVSDIESIANTLQDITKTCQMFELVVDSISISGNWYVSDWKEPLFQHVLDFMQATKCPKVHLDEAIILNMVNYAEKRLGLNILNGSVQNTVQALRSCGYSLQSFATNEQLIDEQIALVLEQKQPIEELTLIPLYPENSQEYLKMLMSSPHAQTLKQLTLKGWSPGEELEKLGDAFPQLKRFDIEFSNVSFVIIPSIVTLRWMKRFEKWSLRNVHGDVLASNYELPTDPVLALRGMVARVARYEVSSQLELEPDTESDSESESLGPRQGTSASPWLLKNLEAGKPIEQVYDEYFNEKVAAEIQVHRVKSFPAPLTVKEYELAMQLSNSLF